MTRKIITITALVLLNFHAFAQGERETPADSAKPKQVSGWGGFTLGTVAFDGQYGLVFGGMGGISNGNTLFGGFGYGGNIKAGQPDADIINLGIGGVFIGYKKELVEEVTLHTLVKLGFGGGDITDSSTLRSELALFRPGVEVGAAYAFADNFTAMLHIGYDANFSMNGAQEVARKLNSLHMGIRFIFGVF